MNYVSDLGLGLSVIGLLALGASGPGYRLGLWEFKTGIIPCGNTFTCQSAKPARQATSAATLIKPAYFTKLIPVLNSHNPKR